MLSPTLSVPVPAAPAQAPTAASAGAAEAMQAPGESFAQRLQQARGTPKAEAAKPQARDAAEPAEDAQTSTDAGEEATRAEQPEPPADLNQLLPGWNPAQVPVEALPRTPQATLGNTAEADASDAKPEADTLLGIAGAKPKAVQQALGALASPDAAARGKAPEAGATESGFKDLLAARQETPNTAPDSAAPARAEPLTQAKLPLEATAALGVATAQGLASPAPAVAAPAAVTSGTFEAHLSAPPGTAQFAPALGVQVSILVREGVQEARLHLHPAEMGPIAVQISVDGAQAQVHFQAEVAATREALQASLPELATALRENGFTLSGGGVSDPRRDAHNPSAGQGQAHGASGQRASRDAEDGAAATAAAARPQRRQGVVDLYA